MLLLTLLAGLVADAQTSVRFVAMDDAVMVDRIEEDFGDRWYCRDALNSPVAVRITVVRGEMLVTLHEDAAGTDRAKPFDVASPEHPVLFESPSGTFSLHLVAARGATYAMEQLPIAKQEPPAMPVAEKTVAGGTRGMQEDCRNAVELIRSVGGTIGGSAIFATRCYSLIVPSAYRGRLTIVRESIVIQAALQNAQRRIGQRSLFDKADELTSLTTVGSGRHYVRVTSDDGQAASFEMQLTLEPLVAPPTRADAPVLALRQTLTVGVGGVRKPQTQLVRFEISEPSYVRLRLFADRPVTVDLLRHQERIDGYAIGREPKEVKRLLAAATYFLRLGTRAEHGAEISIEFVGSQPVRAGFVKRPEG